MNNNYHFDMNKMAKKIQEMRKAAGFRTQQELADAAGIALNSVSRYEKDDPRTPKVDAFALIANALKSECDADYLLGLQEQPTKEITDVSATTSLSREAIKSLIAFKNDEQNTQEEKSLVMKVINSLIIGIIEEYATIPFLEDELPQGLQPIFVYKHQDGLYKDFDELHEAHMLSRKCELVNKEFDAGNILPVSGSEYELLLMSDIAVSGLETKIGIRLAEIVSKAIKGLSEIDNLREDA